jgi:hypothetical protein
MKYFLAYFTLITCFVCRAQFTENFSDEDFNFNPVWEGDDSVFMVTDIAGNKQLQSNKQLPNTTFYLVTPSHTLLEGQWDFYVNLRFNTSSANYVDIYLTADQSDLLNPSMSGYFVRIGGTLDEVSLFRNDSGIISKIIDGQDGITNTSNNKLNIKVTCSSNGTWNLKCDLNGLGINYVSQGTVLDTTLSVSAFFGILITQSTASFVTKHYFDDFYVGPIIYDTTPPVLISATATGSSRIDVLFSEALNPASAQNISNYAIQPFLSVQAATLDLVNKSLVHILLSSPLVNGGTYTLFSTAISDTSINVSGNQLVPFTFLYGEQPLPGDVIITEFMCDPSPSVGLPEAEYVEIFNKSGKYFDIGGWTLGDASGDGTIHTSWLEPGGYKILCSMSFLDTFLISNKVAVTGFPSLNNSGDDIVLKDTHGVVLDKLTYTEVWYHDDIKKNGGYSIERINLNDPCSDIDNWSASNDLNGGTPGFISSVYDASPDTVNPHIINVLAQSPTQLAVQFSEAMDSASLVNADYVFTPTLLAQQVKVPKNPSNEVFIAFSEPIIGSQYYHVSLENAADCWGNSSTLLTQFVLPENPKKGDLIINEIMYNPLTGGSDWIEVYNISNKVIDLKDWQFANVDNDTIANFKTIADYAFLKPLNYAVFGKDSVFVKQHYPFHVPGTFEYLELPSYNNDSGTVYLIYDSLIMDQVSYNDDWHFQLLNNTDGVSLERLDPLGESTNQNNWHSAAESIGFATPGEQNSQFRPPVNNGDFNYTSSSISPDNDGFEDVLQINYTLTEPGLLGNFSIFDEQGRKIRELFVNELLAISGTFSWDGITDANIKATIGVYVGVFECFSIAEGLIYTKTKAFVVAGKL